MSNKNNRLGQSDDLMKNIGERLSKEKNKDEDNSTNESQEEKGKTKENWFDEREPYRSSFIIKPEMEDIFEKCKRKFRTEFKMNLSKQNAIELGWVLLNNLDDSFFNEVKATCSPDDDLIKELKEVIKEYY